MEEGNEKICRICGHHKMEFIYQQKYIVPMEFSLGNVQNIVCCEKCGFVYADSPDTHEKHYNEYYRLLSKYENADNYYIELNEEVRKTKGNIASQIKTLQLPLDAFIVEIGCANGHLLKMIKEEGYSNLLGVDPSAVCVSNAKKSGINAAQGYITSDFSEDAMVDLLILDGVFEHVYDLGKALNHIYRKLKPFGKVLITVPHAGGFGEHYGSPYYYFNLEHINYFSVDDFNNISKLFGFEVFLHNTFSFKYSSKLECEALQVILSKTEKFSDRILRKNLVKKNIIQHVEKSEKEMAKIRESMNSMDRKEPVVIWGAGMHTYKLLGSTDLSSLNISSYIDNDLKKIGLHINGILVRPSDFLKEFKGTIILSTAFSNNVIEKWLKNNGFENTIISLDSSLK